jgi:hypothetical protein
MSSTAIKDIQRSLNVISSITQNQKPAVQMQALEILTQAIITHIHQLQPTAVTTAKATAAKLPKRKAPPLPKPAAASPPANPNATIAAVYNPNATAANSQPAAASPANPA